MKKTTKRPEQMSLAELARATRRFDQQFVFEKAKPMTRAQRGEER